MCVHAKRTHQDRAERHHDHEIENVNELNASESEQQVILALQAERGLHNSSGLIEHGYDCICLSI